MGVMISMTLVREHVVCPNQFWLDLLYCAYGHAFQETRWNAVLASSGKISGVGLAQAKTLEALRRGPAVPLADFSGELVEAHLACTLPPNGTAAFDLRGVKLVYDAKDATLAINGKKSLWPIEEGRLALRVYLDRTGIEVISQDGLNLQPAAVVPDSANSRLSATFSEGVTDIDCRAYSLRSIHGAN